MPKKPLKHLKPWTAEDFSLLRELALKEVPSGEIASQLQRTMASVERKAEQLGLKVRAGRQV
jgi:hypothetical protein